MNPGWPGSKVSPVAILLLLLACKSEPPVATQPIPTQESQLVRVETEPPGAEVYLNWERMGTTPLELKQIRSGQQIYIMLPGFASRAREVAEPRDLLFKMAKEKEDLNPLRLLVGAVGGGQDAEQLRRILTSQLVQEGFYVIPPNEFVDFQDRLIGATLDQRGPLLDWYRTRMSAFLMIVLRFADAPVERDPVFLLLGPYIGLLDSRSSPRQGRAILMDMRSPPGIVWQEDLSATDGNTKSGGKLARVIKEKVSGYLAASQGDRGEVEN